VPGQKLIDGVNAASKLGPVNHKKGFITVSVYWVRRGSNDSVDIKAHFLGRHRFYLLSLAAATRLAFYART
jgi:hypothetical protein